MSEDFYSGIQVALSSGSFFLSAAVNAQITSLFINSSLGIIGYLYLVIGATVVAFVIVLLTVPETKVLSIDMLSYARNKATIICYWFLIVKFVELAQEI